MRIAIISNISNGIGLQLDYELLRDFLVTRGHTVTGIHWLTHEKQKEHDLAIFLEVVPENLFYISARRWVFVNPEWTRPNDERLIRKHFEKVLCKTHAAYDHFNKKFLNVHYVGFLSRDQMDESVPRKRQVLHIGGNGGYRNTNQVLAAWREYRYWDGIPEDLPLIIVSNSTAYEHQETPGVTWHRRLPDEEIKRLQNESKFHLYPSQVEGFGHAMRESQSVNAHLITIDAAPMNELKCSFKIPTCGSREHNAATLYEVNPGDIREKINWVSALSPSDLNMYDLGVPRQEWWVGNQEFEILFTAILNRASYSVDKPTVAVLGNHTLTYCTESDLAWTFEDLGHRVLKFQENQDTSESILADCIANKVKLFIYIHTHGWVTPGSLDMSQVIQELRQRDIATVSFHLDLYKGLNISDGRESRVGTHPFWHTDVVFTADGGHQDWFRSCGVNHRWMKPGVVKKWAIKGNYRADLAIDVGFVGARGYHPEYPFRETLVKFLEDTYGERFRIFSGYREQELNDLYASIKVVVGDSCFGGSPYYWSDRVPETIGRGGFLIHPASQGLTIPGLATYEPQNLSELADKIDWFLGHPQERLALRDTAQAWVKENETYTNRAQEILKVVGLD